MECLSEGAQVRFLDRGGGKRSKFRNGGRTGVLKGAWPSGIGGTGPLLPAASDVRRPIETATAFTSRVICVCAAKISLVYQRNCPIGMGCGAVGPCTGEPAQGRHLIGHTAPHQARGPALPAARRALFKGRGAPSARQAMGIANFLRSWC